jgi:hypothetical protein
MGGRKSSSGRLDASHPRLLETDGSHVRRGSTEGEALSFRDRRLTRSSLGAGAKGRDQTLFVAFLLSGGTSPEVHRAAVPKGRPAGGEADGLGRARRRAPARPGAYRDGPAVTETVYTERLLQE